VAKIGLFFGTQTGNTQTLAEMIQKEFGANAIDLFDVADAEISDFETYTQIIIGCPTWNIGEMQADWEGFMTNLTKLTLATKK
jgi:flavodoxin I